MATTSYQVPMPRIICDICDKIVDRTEREIRYYEDVYVFKVWCHGDTDQCEIPSYIFVDSRLGDFLEGRAFTTRRLTDVKRVASHENSE